MNVKHYSNQIVSVNQERMPRFNVLGRLQTPHFGSTLLPVSSIMLDSNSFLEIFSNTTIFLLAPLVPAVFYPQSK